MEITDGSGLCKHVCKINYLPANVGGSLLEVV